jgi:hypothetical protein
MAGAEQDHEYLKQVIDETSQSFIDVSRQAPPLEEDEAKLRAHDYVRQLHGVSIVFDEKMTMLSMPAVTQRNLGAADVLRAVPDASSAKACGEQISVAHTNLKVQDCGDIVVSFESLV